jgi:hypothetical protein
MSEEQIQIELTFDVVKKFQEFRENDEGHIHKWAEEVDRIITIDETDLNELDPVKFKELILTLITQKL